MSLNTILNKCIYFIQNFNCRCHVSNIKVNTLRCTNNGIDCLTYQLNIGSCHVSL